MLYLDVWRWHIVSPIDTCVPIGAISDMMVQWSRLIIFFLMFSLDFFRLFLLFGLLLEFINIKHGFSVFEKKWDSSIRTTIGQISIDHLVHWNVRNIKNFDDTSPIKIIQFASFETECWRKANPKNKEEYPDVLQTNLLKQPPCISQILTCQIHGSIMAHLVD